MNIPVNHKIKLILYTAIITILLIIGGVLYAIFFQKYDRYQHETCIVRNTSIEEVCTKNQCQYISYIEIEYGNMTMRKKIDIAAKSAQQDAINQIQKYSIDSKIACYFRKNDIQNSLRLKSAIDNGDRIMLYFAIILFIIAGLCFFMLMSEIWTIMQTYCCPNIKN